LTLGAKDFRDQADITSEVVSLQPKNWGDNFSHREIPMAISEIPNSGYAYRVQPLDKDQASQQDFFKGEKKKKSDEKGKKQEETGRPDGDKLEGRINLIA
jgi:hypothetical protein